MNRRLAILLGLPLLLASAVACGSSEQPTLEATPPPAATSPTATPTATAPEGGSEDAPDGGGSAATQDGGTDASAAPAGDAVAEYCDSVDELIELYRDALANPDQGSATELAQRLQALATQAADLLDEAAKDPDAGQRIRECTAKLENLNNPELPN